MLKHVQIVIIGCDHVLLQVLRMHCLRQDFHTKYLAATVAVVLIIGPFFAGHLRPVSPACNIIT